MSPLSSLIRRRSRALPPHLPVKQLAEEDFRLKLGQPRLWTDATAAEVWRFADPRPSFYADIELAGLYVQELVHQKSIKVGKIVGELNPANCLTKHLGAMLKERCISLNPYRLYSVRLEA
eukprot:s283_g1.t1